MSKRARFEKDTIFDENSDEHRLIVWGQYFDNMVKILIPLYEEFLKNPFDKSNRINSDYKLNTCNLYGEYVIKVRAQWSLPAYTHPILHSNTRSSAYFQMGYKTYEMFSKFSTTFLLDITDKLCSKSETPTVDGVVIYVPHNGQVIIKVISKERYPLK